MCIWLKKQGEESAEETGFSVKPQWVADFVRRNTNMHWKLWLKWRPPLTPLPLNPLVLADSWFLIPPEWKHFHESLNKFIYFYTLNLLSGLVDMQSTEHFGDANTN